MRNKFDSTDEEIDLPAHESTGCEYGPSPSDKGHALEMRMMASRAQFAISTKSFEKSVKRFDRTLIPLDK